MSDEMVREIVYKVIDQTESDLILFFVLISVVIIVVTVPLYGIIIKERNARRKHETNLSQQRMDSDNTRQAKYIEREREIIKVITANTEVMSGLKSTLETSNTLTNTSLKRIHDRTDQIFDRLATLSQIQSTLDIIVQKQIAGTEG